jgi:hypothetical protein
MAVCPDYVKPERRGHNVQVIPSGLATFRNNNNNKEGVLLKGRMTPKPTP